MKKLLSLLLALFCFGSIFAQTAILKGRIVDAKTNEAVAFANLVLNPGNIGTTTDIDGNYAFSELSPGVYSLSCSYVGYLQETRAEIRVTPVKPTQIDISLTPSVEQLSEVEITTQRFQKSEVAPMSLRTVSTEEILRNPGGNRDISRVLQILPGVATTLSFRNDLIVRGGAPNENRFYLDGIEVPNINHFATQGSSGGPVGLLNVNFIRQVNFYTGAFPANRGNALSSVMDLRQVSGNTERLAGTFMLGSSDAGITLDGPSGENSSFILSVRRSYLQFLFQALALPFLPTYNDFQYKHDFNFGKNDRLTLIGLGAIDNFELNTSVNDGIEDPETIQRNNYILGNLPVNEQWNYTFGAKWTHFTEKGNRILVLSRSHLNNSATKFQNNVEQPENLLLDYQSEEISNKFRFEENTTWQGWNINAGVNIDWNQYRNSTFNKIIRGDNVVDASYNTSLDFLTYGLFSQASKKLMNQRLTVSAGLRLDATDYSPSMRNPLNQFSPRVSASYALTEKWFINTTAGQFYQLPPFTALGYRDESNALVNLDNNLSYIESNQVALGLEYNVNEFLKGTLEGFYKHYNNYPFSLTDSVSLANLGADFGVLGTDAFESVSQGRSYGLEFFLQQKLSDKIYGLISYTYVRSEFKDPGKPYVPASWDNGHILNITAGRKFNKNWEVGARFQLFGGSPYTPIDVQRSTLRPVWDAVGQGLPDWSRVNTERTDVFHSLDVRVDKRWYFEKWTVNLYLDVENIYNFEANGAPFMDVERDTQGNPVVNPNDPSRYQPRFFANTSGTVLPSIGLMVEW